MKRFLITFLATLYLGVSSGATLQFHYCMGRLVEWGLQSDTSKKCNKCGMKKGSTKDCCKTSEKHFKIEDSYKTSQQNLFFKTFASTLPTVPFVMRNEQLHYWVRSVRQPEANAPPDVSSAPVFVLNCTFLI